MVKRKTKDKRTWTREVRDSRIGVRMPLELRLKVERLAEDDKRSLSDKIVLIIEEHIARGGK